MILMHSTQENATLAALIPGWSRTLKAQHKSPRTIQSYCEAAEKLLAFLTVRNMPVMVLEIRKEHVEAFIADQLERYKPNTAAVRFRSLQQFFRWLEDEEEILSSPMAKMKAPKVADVPVPVIDMEALAKLLAITAGKRFVDRRDHALLRVMIETGARRAELAGIRYRPDPNAPDNDLDLDNGILRLYGKGGKVRSVSLGANTLQALDRYLRARARRKDAQVPWLWLGKRGRFGEFGIAQMVRERGQAIGLPGLHPHQFRHTFAHRWLSKGGSESDLMKLAGWTTRDMLNRYGASAAEQRAIEAARRMALGDEL